MYVVCTKLYVLSVVCVCYVLTSAYCVWWLNVVFMVCVIVCAHAVCGVPVLLDRGVQKCQHVRRSIYYPLLCPVPPFFPLFFCSHLQRKLLLGNISENPLFHLPMHQPAQ